MTDPVETELPEIDPVRVEILERLGAGEGLLAICRSKHMPARSTVQAWQDKDPAFDKAVTRARERGMTTRAEMAVEAAKRAKDPARGRLAFDAERWYIGKLSNYFTDKVKLVGGDETDAPIRTEPKIDFSALSEEQLRALASIRVQSS